MRMTHVITRCVGVLLLTCAMPTLAAVDALQAVCVPAQPSDPTVPHQAYSGAEITLKGIARGAAASYRWRFGDGNADTDWMPIIDSYNLGIKHTYKSDVAGKLFQATLEVKGANGEVVNDTYLVKVFASSDLTNPQHLDVRVNMAIDQGLWWLHTNMQRQQYQAGAPGYEQLYGYWGDSYPLPATCIAVDALQLHGSKANMDNDRDPYVDTVRRGLNYILSNVHSFPIDVETAGNPDTNGNGIGLVANHNSTLQDNRQTYIGGICMAALASTGTPNRVAEVGNENVYKRTYQAIVQDMVDFFAWGQNDSSSGTDSGGWRYYANSGDSDMSTAQWPPLAMVAAKENMGAIIPAFVLSEVEPFLDRYQNTDKTDDNGAFAYDSGQNIYNITKAAAGIIIHRFLNTPVTDPRVQRALGFIYRHWNDAGTSWDYTALHGNSYGMYGVMKAMRLYEPDISQIPEYDYNAERQTGMSFDWYYTPAGQTQKGLASYLVTTQAPEGVWNDSVGQNPVYGAFATGWGIMTLLPGVTINPPQALICACEEQEYNLNRDIHLDGSCSFHPNQARNIVGYAWDLDNDGAFDDAFKTKADIMGGFAVEGFYPVSLRVVDDNPTNLGGPQSDVYVCKVNVHPPPHCPHAFAGGPYYGAVNVPVSLDASASWDPDNEIVLYEWDVDHDGLFGVSDKDCFGKNSDAVGVKPQWTWTAPYSGVIDLRIIDAKGEFDPCPDYSSTRIEIGNQAPKSAPGGPYAAFPGSKIVLDGSRSSDPDAGDVITYAWDLNNDGNFNESTSAKPEFSIDQGAIAGTVYSVCLKVTDVLGEYDVKCTTITVYEAEVWPHPDALTGATKRAVFLDVRANSGSKKISKLDLNVSFDPTMLQVSTGKGTNGVSPGSNWPSTFVVTTNNTLGTVNVSGVVPNGISSGPDLQLGIIHLKTSDKVGTTNVAIGIDELSDEKGVTIVTTVRGDSVITIKSAVCGDVDGNGKVKIIDSLAIARHVLGLRPPPQVNLFAADINADGKVTMEDALVIARHVVKLPPQQDTCFAY